MVALLCLEGTKGGEEGEVEVKAEEMQVQHLEQEEQK